MLCHFFEDRHQLLKLFLLFTSTITPSYTSKEVFLLCKQAIRLQAPHIGLATGIPPLLELPLARLYIGQLSTTLKADWRDREMLELTLSQKADGLWVLAVRRQGEHSKFEMPYIGSHILLADAELGLVVVLVGYHGSSTEKYGGLGYMTQKGQFYRYYRQEADGRWQQIVWRQFTDETRQFILTTVEEHAPQWASKPGKLQAEHKPPTKPTALTTYKVVRFIDGRYL